MNLSALKILETRLGEAKGSHDDDATIERRAIDALIHDNLMPGPKVVVPLSYCSSIDAAVALVERLDFKQWHVDTMNFGAYAEVHGKNGVWAKTPDICPTPALALCLAVVRALIAQGEQ